MLYCMVSAGSARIFALVAEFGHIHVHDSALHEYLKAISAVLKKSDLIYVVILKHRDKDVS